MSDIKVSAIIQDVEGNFLLQLRDEEPGLGKWVLFGGGLENDETYEQTIRREIKEELVYDIKDLTFFKTYSSGKVIQPIYVIEDKVSLDDVVLCEGSDLKFFKSDEIYNLDIGFNYKEIIIDYIKSQK